MRWVFAFLGIVFILTPIAYTFLSIASVVGPTNKEDAVVLGIMLWIICPYIGAISLIEARDMTLKNNK